MQLHLLFCKQPLPTPDALAPLLGLFPMPQCRGFPDLALGDLPTLLGKQPCQYLVFPWLNPSVSPSTYKCRVLKYRYSFHINSYASFKALLHVTFFRKPS